MSLKRVAGRDAPRRGGRDGAPWERGGSGRAGTGGARRFVGPFIIALAAVAVLVALDYWMNAGRIYRGVEVGDVALGGKTPEEAREIVLRRAEGALERVELRGGPEGEISFDARRMGIDYKVRETVQAAYAVGREGNLLERLGERLRAAYGTVQIEPRVDYRPSVARQRIEEVASRLDRPPRQAEVNVYGSEVDVVGSREGYRVDVEATMRSVGEAVEDMSGEARLVGRVLEPEYTTAEAERAAERARRALDGELVLTYEGRRWTVSPAAIGDSLDITARDGEFRVGVDRDRLRENLSGVYAAINQEPVEAGYEISGEQITVTPSRTGRAIQDEKLLGAIEEGIFEGRREYRIPVAVDRPELTTAEAERLKPTDLLATYQTNYLTYDDSPGRVENLEIASAAVDGTLLAPGEVFSFNELAAPLDYHDTKVIINGRVDTAEGGGLCQVSSTLYMAANLAGLDVIERHPHYAELPYIRPGFDATVWFGALDMKFKNTSPGYILIREWVDRSTGTVNAAIYGRPSGIEVDMRSEKVSETVDEEGNPVTTWITYQTVRKNGEVVFDGVLHKDVYKYLKPAAPDAPYDERPVN